MTEVTLPQGDVHLRGTATGVGPTVLLLHAGGERRSVWTPVAAALNKHDLRTVAFDLRGHGDSTGRASTLQLVADDVTAMIHSEPSPLVVVGASLGGLAAIAALADPHTAAAVAGLILVDVVPNHDPARVRTWLTKQSLRDQRTDLVEDIFSRAHELSAATTTLSLPILLVRGGPTSPLSDAEVDQFRAICPRATVSQIPTAGHLVANDAPDDLARIVAVQSSTWLATDTATCRHP
ncbi:hypothetical protein GCM10009745_71290 [Kribbella yunnanensis]|uniref:AB hydrolase-1 domain-containing protein n=1 Tax=Kribbella yunnanensis TaxID=190194 RepID=A0ABN2IVQ8_9ACTN